MIGVGETRVAGRRRDRAAGEAARSALFAASWLLAFQSGACTTPARTPAPSPSVPSDSVPTDPGEPPFVARIEGPASVRPGETITLELIVDRRAEAGALALALTLPPGVTLERGRAKETLPAGAAPVRRRYVLELAGTVPEGDVMVTLDSRQAGRGAHAVSRYRFGRPEPRLPEPPIRKGSIPLGRGP